MRQISVARLFESLRDPLQLEHICGPLERPLAVSDSRWAADLVGHLNLIHPERLQVIGSAELAWVSRQAATRLRHYLEDLFLARPAAAILADGCEVPRTLRDLCETHGVALFTTPEAAASIIDHFRGHLARELAERTSLHGVFMDVLGIGVLITGDSGTGKSELALELISRGHGLVADDVIEFAAIAPMVIEGRCPELLQDFLEVRGLGILNIRTIFGETAARRKKRLHLIVHLERKQAGQTDPDRLPQGIVTQDVLGVAIPRVVLPVAAGRNLAVLLEAAVRTTILKLRGIDATAEFIQRHERLMQNPDGEQH